MVRLDVNVQMELNGTLHGSTVFLLLVLTNLTYLLALADKLWYQVHVNVLLVSHGNQNNV